MRGGAASRKSEKGPASITKHMKVGGSVCKAEGEAGGFAAAASECRSEDVADEEWKASRFGWSVFARTKEQIGGFLSDRRRFYGGSA